jgi:hypothetical protein
MWRPIAVLLLVNVVMATGRCEAASAADYATSAAPVVLRHRGELQRRIEPMMVQQARWLVGLLRPWEQDPQARLLTRGGSGEHDIRPNAHTAYGLAVMARTLPADIDTTLTREFCRDTAISMLRFMLATHKAGGRKCADGKQWYGQWQSALWAYTAGKAAWLLWDDLDPELQRLAAAMICDEADRLSAMEPPFKIISDTKSEENAWNSTVISLAYNMFPNHARREVYHRNAVKWCLSSYLRQADLDSTRVVDGKPLREWNLGANIHDDFTLENHDRVHPDYMNSMVLLLSQNLMYEWGGNPSPEALSYNLPEIYGVLKKMAMPDGGYVYPNGQDWSIHRVPQWVETHACLAVYHNDRDAARLLRLGMDTSELMAKRQPDGPIYLETEHNFPSTQHFELDKLANVYVMLASRGEGPEPTPDKELWASLTGVHQFEAGSLAIIRNPSRVATFSWGQRLMGMVMPLDKDPIVAPNERSFVGAISAPGVPREGPQVRKVNARLVHDESGKPVFIVAGIADRAQGAIEQRFAFICGEDDPPVYVDMLKGDDRTASATLDLGLASVLNEANWVHQTTPRRFGDPVSEWFNREGTPPHPRIQEIDGRMSVAVLGANGEPFLADKGAPFRARVEQNLILNRVTPEAWQKGHPAAGPYTACTAMVFLVGHNLATGKSLGGREFKLESNITTIRNLSQRDEIDWDKLEVRRYELDRRVF